MKFQRTCNCGQAFEIESGVGEPDGDWAKRELADWKTTHAECFRLFRDTLKAQCEGHQAALKVSKQTLDSISASPRDRGRRSRPNHGDQQS